MIHAKEESVKDMVIAMHEDGFSPSEMYEAIDNCHGIGTIYSYHAQLKLKPHKRPRICPHCGKDVNKEM